MHKATRGHLCTSWAVHWRLLELKEASRFRLLSSLCYITVGDCQPFPSLLFTPATTLATITLTLSPLSTLFAMDLQAVYHEQFLRSQEAARGFDDDLEFCPTLTVNEVTVILQLCPPRSHAQWIPWNSHPFPFFLTVVRDGA